MPHSKLPGGHVTVGGVIYQGDSLPAEFRGKYIAADLLGHAAYWHELVPRGSTFSATYRGDFLLAGDTWFAPSDVTVGPDGSVYICDWHDQRTAHPDPDADWDRSNGRIYRIKSKELSPKPVAELASLSSEKLVAMLGSTNDWVVRKARRILADRRDPEMIFPLRTLVRASDDHLTLEALWALAVVGGLSDEFAIETLAHRSPDVRWWTVRLLGDEECVSPAVAARLADLASSESSVAVRAQLAASAKRLPPAQALPIVRNLIKHGEDIGDPYMPLLLWWAIERQVGQSPDEVLALVTDGATWRLPLVHEVILERLMRRMATEASRRGYLACARLLDAAPAEDRGRMLAALDQGLKDRTSARGGSEGTLYAAQAIANRPADAASRPAPAEIPAQLLDKIDRLWDDATSDMTLVRLTARLGRPAAVTRAIALASDARLPAAKRVEAVQLLGDVGGSAALDSLLSLYRREKDDSLKSALLAALSRFDDDRVAAQLLKQLASLPPPERSKVYDVLLSRGRWAAQLLERVDHGQIESQDIAVDQLRNVALHHDKRLDALVKKHWGSIQGGTPEERLAEMRRINNDLRAGRGDLAAGHALFLKHCGTCHRLFDEGNQVGPELTRANRKNTDELLATIVNPSAVIRKEYMSFLVQANDGRVLTGLLVDQTPGAVTLLDAKNVRTTIERDKIESIAESATSLMPENLLTPLKPQELRDLFGYLQSDPPMVGQP